MPVCDLISPESVTRQLIVSGISQTLQQAANLPLCLLKPGLVQQENMYFIEI